MRAFIRKTILAAVSLALAAFVGRAAGQTQVGDTRDACDAANVVSFTTKGGKKLEVRAGDKNKDADLFSPVRELEWFCGTSQEFSSNDVPYDRVRVTRADNGAIHFVFFRLPPPTGGSVHTATVGDTAAGCHKQHTVSVQGVSGKVSIAASETKIVDLPAATKKLDFQCGNDGESAENDTFFDRVRVSRNSNGAIQFTFYLKTAAADPTGVCDKVHATGRLLFKDADGSIVPLPKAHVKLMDEDFGPSDSKMAEGFTDDDGRYDMTGSSHDSGCIGAGCKRPDPYVQFILRQDHRVDVRDPVENTAQQKTETQVNKCGDVKFDDQVWSHVGGSADLDPILYNRAQIAYDNFTKATGDARVPGHEGLVGVEYPTVFIATTMYTTWDSIHWPFHGDQMLDFASLDHEFGHRIRAGADGDRAHFNWDASRFYYGRPQGHTFTDVTNEGFAFNEGWAEFHESLSHSVSVPNGTWGSPKGDDVEGDVATQLFNIEAKCGHFGPMWAALKGAGHAAIHSIDEFKAEFLRRNPHCVEAGGSPSSISKPLPGGPVFRPATPTPTPRFAGGPLPKVTGLASLVTTPSPMNGEPFPPGGARSDLVGRTPDELKRLQAEHGRQLDAHISEIEARAGAAVETARIRIPTDLPAASRPALERLGARNVDLARTFHTQAVRAYREVLQGLPALSQETILDGSYEAKRSAAKDAFAAKVFEARLAHIQAARREIAAERTKAKDPKLAAHLARLDRSYEREENRLEEMRQNRKPGDPVPADLLPKTFVAKTTRR